MPDDELTIFGNLPRRRGDDERLSRAQALLRMNFVEEGPLPPRPHPSGKGGPSINQTPTPPVVTSVWSASDAAAGGLTLSNGGLTVTQTTAASWAMIRSTISKSSGKLYVEFSTSAAVSPYMMVGLADAGAANGVVSFPGFTPYGGSLQTANNGFQRSAGFTPVTTGNIGAVAANDVLAIAIDFTAQQFWIAQNNVWVTGDPATGAAPLASFILATVGPLFPALGLYSAGTGVWTLQATAASQKYAPPSGFSPWG
jgi:hypothetical protein